MSEKAVILNCDLGEGLDNEHLIMPFIQACNLACGGHAGNEETMTRVVNLAVKHDVAIGAHPSYPDKINFGRVSMNISEFELINTIREQINTLLHLLKKVGVRMHHIKPHGALYNDIASNQILGKRFLKAIEPYRDSIALFVPYGSAIAEMARKSGFKVLLEGFADRNYNTDYSLVSRTLPNAVLTEPKLVLNHMKSMVLEDRVKTITGEFIAMHANTYCVHSDTKSALEILKVLHNKFCL